MAHLLLVVDFHSSYISFSQPRAFQTAETYFGNACEGKVLSFHLYRGRTGSFQQNAQRRKEKIRKPMHVVLCVPQRAQLAAEIIGRLRASYHPCKFQNELNRLYTCMKSYRSGSPTRIEPLHE